MLLDKLNTPDDLRNFSLTELKQLCSELRDFVLTTTAVKEGHIQSSLGVTELSVALHYCFNTPHDILVWDVGHQAYIHKVLTGRKSDFASNRKLGGLSGFTKRAESAYDPFGAGHSSTSISAAVGFAYASRLAGEQRKHIAVIGDGALTGGMSFEALNYLGQEQLEVVVVLNDNNISIDENVGFLSVGKDYKGFFESLGLSNYHEVDGHEIDALCETFQEVRSSKGPVVVRAITSRNKGGKGKAKEKKSEVRTLSFQEVFGSTLLQMAKTDERVVAVTPAMLSGSGLKEFKSAYPERVIDVGITEQHAVTMSAGMAASGLRPFCHLYSTFSQRAFDQIIHDVALQDLPVVFCLDRAGLVGADGPTHHGAFDNSFLNAIPNIILSSPRDGASLKGLMQEALLQAEHPFVIRYIKGGQFSDGELAATPQLPIGKGMMLKEGSKGVVLSYGPIGQEVEKAIEGLPVGHFDVIYLKPIDRSAIVDILNQNEVVITVDESSGPGALGDCIRKIAGESGYTGKVRSMCLPDQFVEHGSRDELLQLTGLDAASIREQVLRFMT